MKSERMIMLYAMYKNAVEYDNLNEPYYLIKNVDGVIEGLMQYQYLEGKGLISIESDDDTVSTYLTADGVDVIEEYLGSLSPLGKLELNNRLVIFNMDRLDKKLDRRN